LYGAGKRADESSVSAVGFECSTVGRLASVVRIVAVCLAPLAVLLAVGLVSRDDAGGTGSADTQSTSVNEVAVQQFQFKPQTVTVSAGTTVTWTNQDGFEHSVVDRQETFRGDPFGTGEMFTHTYSDPGTFEYFCGIHNSMTGTVVVTD
jgi:plastocyanin